VKRSGVGKLNAQAICWLCYKSNGRSMGLSLLTTKTGTTSAGSCKSIGFVSSIALKRPYLFLMSSKPEKMHQAKDLSNKTGLPYRVILEACKSGELPSYRPAGGNRGCIYITETDWATWLERIRIQPTVTKTQKVPAPKRALGTTPIEALAL